MGAVGALRGAPEGTRPHAASLPGAVLHMEAFIEHGERAVAADRLWLASTAGDDCNVRWCSDAAASGRTVWKLSDAERPPAALGEKRDDIPFRHAQSVLCRGGGGLVVNVLQEWRKATGGSGRVRAGTPLESRQLASVWIRRWAPHRQSMTAEEPGNEELEVSSGRHGPGRRSTGAQRRNWTIWATPHSRCTS